MKTEPKYYANICNSVYQVRVTKGAAEILYDGQWMSSDAFVDALMKAGKRDELRELITYGLRMHPEKCVAEIEKQLGAKP